MSINLRTGQPGHGKSYSAVVEIRDALERGQYVATNVPLSEGWALTMARSNWFRRVIPGRCAKLAAEYERRLYHVDDLRDLRRLRLPKCGSCPGCKRGTGCRREGRGLAVLDEAHKWLNARTWDADETGQAGTKAEAVRRRLDIVRFFSTHRHYGWNVELITQDEGNLDRQVRSLFETHTHLKNMRRFKVLGIFPIVPFNFFVAVTHWHDNDKTRLGIKTYTLSKSLARCYDTFGAAREDEDADDVIVLGQLGQPAAADRAERVAAASAPPAPPVPTPTMVGAPPVQRPETSDVGSSIPPMPTTPTHAERPALSTLTSPANGRDVTSTNGSPGS